MVKTLKNFSLLRVLLAVLIIFIPLYPKFPLQFIPGTHVAVRLDDVVVSLCILVYLIYQTKHRFPVFKPPITRLFLVYFAAVSLSTLHALLIFQTQPPHILLLHLLRRFEYISVFFLTISTIKKPKDLHFTYLCLLLTVTLVCLYGLGQKFLNLPVISTMNNEFAKGQLLYMDYWARINSTFAGHYDLAAFLSLILIIIGSLALTHPQKKVKIASSLVWALSFYTLVLTASRISIFALWGAFALTLFLLKKYFWILPLSLLIILSIQKSSELNRRLTATLPTLPQISPKFSLPQLKKPQPTSTPTSTPTPAPMPTSAIVKPSTPKTTSIPTPTIIRHQLFEQIPIDTDAGVARSGEIRFKVEWPRALTAYRKNPLTGTGLGSLTLATDNDYLRLLGESGILGFISFSAVFIYFFVKTIPSINAKRPNFHSLLNLVLLGATASFLANALFIDVFEASKTAYLFWIMMGLYHQNLKFSSHDQN